MSSKKYLGVVLILIPVLLILVTLAILFHNKNMVAVETEGSWINIGELSQEFLDNYFEEYTEMRKDADPDNILMVTSRTRPNDYGALKVIEAPNYLYILQYNSGETRDMAFAKLEADGMIVEKNQTLEVMGNYLSWGVEKMHLNTAMTNVSSHSDVKEVTVAVIDTGMNMDKFYEYMPTRRIATYCVVECDGGMDDRNQYMHGTHVGGTVMEGTGSNVGLLAIKVTNDAAGILALTDTVTAINYAVAQGVDVINLSLGGGLSDMSHPDAVAEKNALDAAAAAGVVNVASAGNSDTDELFYPASFDSVMSIAAVNSSLNRWVDSAHTGSNYGDKIDFAAPGANVDGINDYIMSGTSMASPHIAAAVANLKSINKSVKQDDAKELLKKVATDIGENGWDPYYGWGFVDFNNAQFCDSGDICDRFGIFEADYAVDNKTGSVATYNIYNNTMTVTSDKAAMVIANTADGYVRIPAAATADANVYTFDLASSGSAEIVLVLVGDVTLDGRISPMDLARLQKSTLLDTSPNYQPLSELGSIAADITKDGRISPMDLARLQKSILLDTSPNYQPLSW